MSDKIKWGIISTANIGMQKVIPAMQKSKFCQMEAIASRDLATAKEAASQLGIAKAYGSYEALLDDKDIDAIYIPLPNHLHVEYTFKCMEAGKHVLCEKPLALTTEEIKKLIVARDQYNVKVGEAFMVDSHPQWSKAKEMIHDGSIGELKAINGYFCYNNTDPNNIRNIAQYGGGGLWDIGCYPVHTSRFITGQEPTRVSSLIDFDPDFNTDRHASVLMDFPTVRASFMVSTQLPVAQTMQFFGSKKRLTIEIPFNAPPDKACRILINNGDIFNSYNEEIQFEICDQYGYQGDAFSKAILEDIDVPVPLENTLWNTAVLNAIYRSGETKQWEPVENVT